MNFWLAILQREQQQQTLIEVHFLSIFANKLQHINNSSRMPSTHMYTHIYSHILRHPYMQRPQRVFVLRVLRSLSLILAACCC